MPNEREKIVELRRVLENIQFILTGELTEVALRNLRNYVDRELKSFDEWGRIL